MFKNMKFTKYFLSLAAAVGMAAACQKAEIVQIEAPENAVAPVVEEIDPIYILDENLETGEVAVKWTSADFGAPTQINYSLEISLPGGEKRKVLSSGISDTTAVISYMVLNTAMLTDYELEANIVHDLELYVGAKVGNYAQVYSEPVAIKVQPVAALIPEATIYASQRIWAIGDFCGWDHGKSQYLYDYNKTGTTYTGVVDFGGNAANGFKFTGVAAWDDTCNWGPEVEGAAAQGTEPAQMQLITGGGAKNIVAYSKRFYNFEFDRTSLVLTVKNSFDKLEVIGDVTATTMEYNPVFVRFYADVQVAADGGIKVRADEDDAVVWGAADADITGAPAPTGTGSGLVKAGNYRIYFDLNKGTLQASAAMYGKEEPGLAAGPAEPETPEVTWAIYTNEDSFTAPAYQMNKTSDTVWEVKKLALEAGLKIQLVSTANAWLGGPEKNQGNAYKPTLGTAFPTGKEDILIETAGDYDIVLDLDKSEIKVSTTPLIEGWSVIGVNGWNDGDDILMTQEGPLWYAKGVDIAAGAGFKIREDGAWNNDRGGAEDVNAPLGVGFQAVAGGKNLKVEEGGSYDIYYHEIAEELFICKAGEAGPEYWYLVGAYNNWTVGDGNYMMLKEGEYLVFKNFTLADKGEVKFNAGGWAVNRGGDVFAVDAELPVTQDGPNLKVEAGTYDIYLSADLTKAYFMTPGKTPAEASAAPEPEKPTVPETMYIIGTDFGNWDWSAETVVTMNPVAGDNGAGQFWAIRYINAASGFKFCAKKEWSGGFHSLKTNDGYTVADGNCVVDANGIYMIHVDMVREMIHIEPARVYGMGECFGGWTEGMEGALFAAESQTLKGTLAADGNIRLYAASSISNSDWWSREFIFYDGKIAYRGAGGDQTAVAGTAGQKITLNFNEGTATVE